MLILQIINWLNKGLTNSICEKSAVQLLHRLSFMAERLQKQTGIGQDQYLGSF